MSFRSLEELLDDQLQELHAAEAHVIKDLPALVGGAFSEELKSLLQQHLYEAENHERVLAMILKKRNIAPHVGRCRVVDVLLKRGREIADTRGNSLVLDVGLTFILRAVETYEQCAYSAAKTLAEALDLHDLAEILQTSARDEEKMEQSFTVLSEDMVDAAQVKLASASSPLSSTQTRGAV